jgi:hypothetical protein
VILLGGIFLLVAPALAEEPGSDPSSQESGTVEVSGKSRVRIGGVLLTGGYRRSYPIPYGDPYLGYSPYLYDPFWAGLYAPPIVYTPLGYPGYLDAFSRGSDKGEIKLNAEPKTAEVFLNDAYAGTVGDLRSFWLEPGVYDLKIEAPDGGTFSRRIYVLSGKTLKIDAELTVPKREQQP